MQSRYSSPFFPSYLLFAIVRASYVENTKCLLGCDGLPPAYLRATVIYETFAGWTVAKGLVKSVISLDKAITPLQYRVVTVLNGVYVR